MNDNKSTLSNNRSVHIWVSGRVQGVNFRSSTLALAKKLNIHGWVKNSPDGRVEILACGPAMAINDFIQWLYQGPPLAKVTHVEIEETHFEPCLQFSIMK